MDEADIDDIDLAILRALQDDARNNTNAAISEELDISASTVGKRIKSLEDRGVIREYIPILEYEQTGFPLQMVFVCTASVAERPQFIDEALALDGVIEVRELMAGQKNVHVRAVAASTDDMTRIAAALDELGLTVVDEILIRSERHSPIRLPRPDRAEE